MVREQLVLVVGCISIGHAHNTKNFVHHRKINQPRLLSGQLLNFACLAVVLDNSGNEMSICCNQDEGHSGDRVKDEIWAPYCIDDGVVPLLREEQSFSYGITPRVCVDRLERSFGDLVDPHVCDELFRCKRDGVVCPLRADVHGSVCAMNVSRSISSRTFLVSPIRQESGFWWDIVKSAVGTCARCCTTRCG